MTHFLVPDQNSTGAEVALFEDILFAGACMRDFRSSTNFISFLPLRWLEQSLEQNRFLPVDCKLFPLPLLVEQMLVRARCDSNFFRNSKYSGGVHIFPDTVRSPWSYSTLINAGGGKLRPKPPAKLRYPEGADWMFRDDEEDDLLADNNGMRNRLKAASSFNLN